MAANGALIVRRYMEGKSQRSNKDAVIRAIAPYTDPSRIDIQSGASHGKTFEEGAAWMQNVYDSQTIFAHDLAAQFIGGQSMNPATQWMGVQDANYDVNGLDEVREYYEECRDRMLAQLSNSSFYGEAHECVKDWWGFGDGPMLLEENPMLPNMPRIGFRGPRVIVEKPGRYVLRRNYAGMVDGFDREFMYTPDQAVKHFGKENVSEKIREKYDSEQHRYTELISFIHSISPRDPKDAGPRATAAQRMPFASVYVETEHKNVVLESGYKTFPVAVASQLRVFGEIYSRGRADIAFNDIMSLNAAKRLELQAVALAIRPPTFVPYDLLGGVNPVLVPGAFITSRMPPGARAMGDNFYRYEPGRQWQNVQINEQEIRRTIREIYMVDLLRQVMEVDGQKEMTAFEYGRKLRLIMQVMAPLYNRLQHGLQIPFIIRLFNMMQDARAFPPPPDVLLNEGGAVRVTFDSPLARAQKSDQITAREQYIAHLFSIAEGQAKFLPKQTGEILDNVPWDQWAQDHAIDYGVPAKDLNSPREVATIRGSRAEQEAANQVNSELAGGAEALGRVAPFLKVVGGQG